MKIGHLIGIAAALGALVLVELYSSRKVKNAEDFDKGGGHSGIMLVCGALLGSLIGGQSTIGTAQLAYVYGLSAIWFTLGAALGCIALFLGYVIPLRKSHDTTLMEVIGDEFGPGAEYIGSILCSAGMLISIISNVIASAALIMAMTGCALWIGCLVSVLLMCAYVVFGGVIGAGMGGIVKLILLYLTSIICIGLVVVMGVKGQTTALAEVHLSDLFARGVTKEVCNCLSLILGVLSTQTYAQAIWSARSYHVARKAALLSGILCIPVGFGGVLIGLAMRAQHLPNPAEAFPLFLLQNLPPIVGGLGVGALLITVVTGGGGLALGVSTIFVRDILGRMKQELMSGSAHIIAMRLTIAAVLGVTGLIAVMLPGAIINDLGFLSMGLRGSVIFVPLSLALFLKKRFRSEAIFASMIAGPVALVLTELFSFGAEPLIVGVGVSLLICALGYKKPEREELSA